jgi:hypothetical protein
LCPVLKALNIPAELHIYGNVGHCFGMRASNKGAWLTGRSGYMTGWGILGFWGAGNNGYYSLMKILPSKSFNIFFEEVFL